MRGEKVSVDIGDGSEPGSPPHARGKEDIYLAFTGLTGITPVCAGKSRWSQTIYHRLRDHPRVCGEK